ncbi:DUF1440 domain-containing protein [Rubrivirga sp. S365]|uniref:DUF1440 domain-containing protein n=1 Tax=Rubrivirga sp. S365 TaxID=3076080 RepID=UPI0028CAA41F|nr:DUF1440 domain-containing protein [Rubrivirga sp. S365]MDT7858371.1 DUF1440 domain-containing protein [Rubrivirga sp. S365]
MFDAHWTLQHREPSLVKGAVAGLVGGLAASWVMNQFQAAVPSKTFKTLLGEAGGTSSGSSSGGESAAPATVQAAEAVSEGVLDHELTNDEKEWAGPAVHYALGSGAGLAYGLLAEAKPGVTAGLGLPFGVAFWLGADEGAVPALGLSKAPWAYPPSVHVYSLVSHVVYGLSAEAVRRLVRSALR